MRRKTEQERLYQEELERVQKAMMPRVQAIRESRRITAEDLAIIVNV